MLYPQVSIQFTCGKAVLRGDLFVPNRCRKDGWCGIYFSKNLKHGLSAAFRQKIVTFGKVTKAPVQYPWWQGGNITQWQLPLCMGMSWFFAGVIWGQVFNATCLFLTFSWVPCPQQSTASFSNMVPFSIQTIPWRLTCPMTSCVILHPHLSNLHCFPEERQMR